MLGLEFERYNERIWTFGWGVHRPYHQPLPRWLCYWHHLGFARAIQLGFRLDLSHPMIELHLPGGFLRIGYARHSF